MTIYLAALALTLLAEGLVVAAIAPAGQRRRFVAVSLFVNLFTHPIANAVHAGTPRSFVGVEGCVVLVEALLYVVVAGCGPVRALLLAIAANVASIVVGLLFLDVLLR